MGTWSYVVAGQVAVETVPDDLDDYYVSRHGYTRVQSEAELEAQRAAAEAEVAELKGDKLADAVEELGIDPHLSAEEKRQAILEERTGTAGTGTITGPSVTGVTVTTSNAGTGAETDQTQER